MIHQLVLFATPSTKKTSNLLLCVERGTRCRACRLPARPVCPVCHRAKTGRHIVAPSNESQDFERTVLPQLRQLWERAPIEVSVRVTALVYRAKSIGDAVGFYQSIGDALERGGVIANDRLIADWDGSRLLKDAARPRIEITITELEATASTGPVKRETMPLFAAPAPPAVTIRRRVIG